MADEEVLAAVGKAIADIESGGHENPYDAVGPRTGHGDRAYGKYQMMGNNIPSWTEEAGLGRLSPQEFVKNPDAQEKVFYTKMGKYLDDHGGSVEDAASLWHSGVLYDRAAAEGRRDARGTHTTSYVDHIVKAIGGSQIAKGAASPEGGALPPDLPDLTSAMPDIRGAEAAAPAFDPQQVLKDPKFWALGADDRLGVMQNVDPRFAKLAPDDQQAVLQKYQPKGFKDESTLPTPQPPAAPPVEPPGIIVSKPAWYSGLADEAGEHFARAVHNAAESAKSLAQAPESVRQVVGDLLGMMEPWTVPGQMSGEAAGKATGAAGGGEHLQRVARVLGTIAGSMATPAPPGVGLATKGVGKAIGVVTGRSAVAGEEAASAARAAAPEAATAAETVAGAASGSAESAAAPSVAGEALASSGATTEQIGADVKSALGARQTTLKDQAGSIYDNAVTNADAAGAALASTEYPALQAHLKAVRARLGTLPPQAESAVANLETKAASGAPISAGDLNGYKAAVDQTFPGKMKSGAEVRDWLRSLFSAEDREWAGTADKLWRDELVGRGMTETSLGSLTKLIKKSDPGAAVEKLFGSGANDRQGALARSVLRHLEVESPEVAQSLRDAVFNRAITRASSGGNDFGTALLKEYDSFNPAFRSAISNPGADAFFTVLRQELGNQVGPSRAAMMTARGLKVAGAGVAEAVGRHFGVSGTSLPAAAMEMLIPTADLAKFLSNSQTAKLLARALKTPMNSAVVPTILKSLRDSRLGQELLATPAGQQKQSEAQRTMEIASAAG